MTGHVRGWIVSSMYGRPTCPPYGGIDSRSCMDERQEKYLYLRSSSSKTKHAHVWIVSSMDGRPTRPTHGGIGYRPCMDERQGKSLYLRSSSLMIEYIHDASMKRSVRNV